MSGYKVQQSGSSAEGYTFVRPLPKVHPAAASDSDIGSQLEPLAIGDSATGFPVAKSSPAIQSDLLVRLFPNRHQEDSGNSAPVTGLELGHFVIEERIGRGGMGAVFRALDRRLDRVVALKVLSVEHSSDPEAVIRFQNEARAAARLDHNNVARVYYIGEEKGLHFIAFEFVSGTNVRNLILQKGRLAPSAAVNYVLQIADALRQTAAANVVHRDIKPSNIIISPTGRATLVDLGLARQVNTETSSKDITVAGTTLGTFDYIAPEQAIDARKVDVRADIYSLGCTLYHMLTGEPPYPNGTMFEKVMNHHRPTPPDPRAKNLQVSEPLSRVVQKMMASNPDERYATPDSLISDLVRIAEAMGLHPSYPETTVWTSPLFDRRPTLWEGTRAWLVTAVTLLILVLLVDRIRWIVQGDMRAAVSSHEVVIPPPPADDVQPDPLAFLPLGMAPEAPQLAVLETEQSPLTQTQQFSSGVLNSLDQFKSVRVDQPLTMPPHPAPDTTPRPPAEATTIPPAEEVTEAESPFIVRGAGGVKPKGFATLAAACAAAADNSVIEIRADGTLGVQTEPIRLVNKRLKIRPIGNGRPRLQFDLSQHLVTSQFSRTAKLIELKHAALEIYDLDVEFTVHSEAIADQWALVTLLDESEFVARGASLTLSNRDRLPASFIHFAREDAANIAEIMPERMKAKPSRVSLSECICRGQADFVLQETLKPERIQLINAAFAISGTLIRLDGSNVFYSGMGAEEEQPVSLELNHVTAILGQELLLMSAGDHGELPDVEFVARNSIVLVQEPGHPLINISGHHEYEVLVNKLRWIEHSDPNFVFNDAAFCVIDSPLLSLTDVQEMSPQDFGITNVEVLASTPLSFPRKFSQQTLQVVQPIDFEIVQSDQNPTIQASSDGRDAGVDWTLTRLPADLPTP